MVEVVLIPIATSLFFVKEYDYMFDEVKLVDFKEEMIKLYGLKNVEN